MTLSCCFDTLRMLSVRGKPQTKYSIYVNNGELTILKLAQNIRKKKRKLFFYIIDPYSETFLPRSYKAREG